MPKQERVVPAAIRGALEAIDHIADGTEEQQKAAWDVVHNGHGTPEELLRNARRTTAEQAINATHPIGRVNRKKRG